MARVYNCEEPEEILRDIRGIKFQSGLSVELILKVLKWFFIEGTGTTLEEGCSSLD